VLELFTFFGEGVWLAFTSPPAIGAPKAMPSAPSAAATSAVAVRFLIAT